MGAVQAVIYKIYFMKELMFGMNLFKNSIKNDLIKIKNWTE